MCDMAQTLKLLRSLKPWHSRVVVESLALSMPLEVRRNNRSELLTAHLSNKTQLLKSCKTLARFGPTSNSLLTVNHETVPVATANIATVHPSATAHCQQRLLLLLHFHRLIRPRYSLTMATRRAAEERLDAAIFIPPKSDMQAYDLLQALNVEGKNGRAVFSSLDLGVSKEFIKEKMPAKMQELEQLLAPAESTTKPEDFAESFHLFDAKNGSLGNKIQHAFLAKVGAESSSDSGHVVALTDMEKRSIPMTTKTSTI